MTRKHFEALATQIKRIEDKAARVAAATAVARACADFNPAFNAARFYAACDAL